PRPLLLSLSFPCSPPPRALHSSPTRRSSDLWRGWPGRLRRRQEGAPWRRCSHLAGDDRARVLLEVVRDRLDPDLHRPGGLGRDPDRKSTRLNSSHVAISYAVFCLKKKKKKKK